MSNAYHSRWRYRLRYLSKTGSRCPGSWSFYPDQVALLDLVMPRSRFSFTDVLEATGRNLQKLHGASEEVAVGK